MRGMRVGALQFDVARGDTARNLAAVERGLAEAASSGCGLVCLPEMWPTSFPGASEVGQELLAASTAAVARVAELSGELGLVVAGSAFAEHPDGPPANRLTVHDRGELLLSYEKVHLFSPTAEGESFSAGSDAPSVVDTSAGRLAAVVCYDLRFGACAEAAFAGAPDLLLCPAQWPRPRESHWRALVHGRAVEGQCFVIAANRTGTELVGRRRVELEFPGNSLVVDPHGRTLAEGRGEAGLVVAEIDLEVARRLRVRVPVGKDCREGLYAQWRAERSRKTLPASEGDTN